MTTKKMNKNTLKLGSDCVAFMLDKMRYEFNGIKINRNRNVGIISIIKNNISLKVLRSFWIVSVS